MALKSRLMGMAMDQPEAQSSAATTRPRIEGSRSVSPVTSIDSSTKVQGKIRCKETIRIDGEIKGEVRCEKSVIVGQAAILEASIEGDEVTIAGSVKGDIIARRKITLERTAQVTGDLSTPGIVIEEGAQLEGRIEIGAKQQPKEKAPRKTEPRRSASSASASTPETPTAQAAKGANA